MSDATLKIALVVDNEYLAAWQHLMLQRLLVIPRLELVAVVFHPLEQRGGQRRLNHWVLHGSRLLDSSLFHCLHKARKPTLFLPLLGDTPRFTQGNVQLQHFISRQAVDIVVDMTGEAALPQYVAWARYGVWRHVFGYPFRLHDHYVAVLEYLTDQTEIITGIEGILATDAEPVGLFYATTSTDPMSIGRGVEHTLWKMAEFIPQRIAELQSVGARHFFQAAKQRAAEWGRPPQYTPHDPSLTLMLRIFWQYWLNLNRKLYRLLAYHEQWVLLIGEARLVSKPTGLDLNGLIHCQKLIPPADRFWADPFLVEHEHTPFLFFEEFVYATAKGVIACIQQLADGTYSQPITVLERDYHLSYPFVFQYAGEYYMIPETAGNRTIELYRCAEFPHRWVFEKYLMQDVEAYDTTVVEYQQRWWMFVCLRQHDSCSPNETLYLFHADSPLSQSWQAHPQNPIVAQASRARPAGRIFELDGQLFRPSQDCAGTYGRGLNINLIQQLTTQAYQEIVQMHCLPDGQLNISGVHTLNIGTQLVVSDAMYVHRHWKTVRRYGMRIRHWLSRGLRVSGKHLHKVSTRFGLAKKEF